MSSKTLKAILNHWEGHPQFVPSPIELPFNVELFCGENDELLTRLQSQLEIAKEVLGEISQSSCKAGMGYYACTEECSIIAREALEKLNG